MKSKKVRNIKVISQNGRNYKPTPIIILKGQWLNEIGVGVFTVVEVRQGKGSEMGWGRLKSGAGWIALSFCERV